MRAGFQNRQVAAVHDVPPERCALLDQPAKMRIELWGTTCDVHARDRASAKGFDALSGCLTRHDLGSIGACIYVAVTAGLVAELAHVDLHDLDGRGQQGPQPFRAEGRFEVGAHGQIVESSELPVGFGKREAPRME